MSIQYTYEVIAVNQSARCMEVVYASEGNPTMHIGARLPFEGETLQSVVELYSPVAYWRDLKTPTIPVESGESGDVVIPDPILPSPTAMALAKRNALLASSDWTQLPDVPLSVEQKSDWAAYRQQLRDITSQTGFPDNIAWPIEPGVVS